MLAEPANSLSERIYVKLRSQLIAGEYAPGTMLNIRRLAQESNVSPTPAREAVMQLVREGALELRLGHQPRVPVLSLDKYAKIRDARAPLERLATELAAANMTVPVLDRIKALHGKFVKSEELGIWKDALSANKEFHFTIYSASGNEVLVRVIENLWLLTGPFITHQYPNVARASLEVHPHVLLIDALERRQPAEAGDLVVQDLREGSFLILKHLDKRYAI